MGDKRVTKNRKLQLVILLIIAILGCVVFFYPSATEIRVSEESIGKYIYDSSSEYNLALSAENKDYFEEMKLEIKEDNTFEFSNIIPHYNGSKGEWDVEGPGHAPWINFHFEGGKNVQVGPCFEGRINFPYPHTSKNSTRTGSDRFGTIYFKK